jgi:DNA-binding MarR family transcriptional regulator
MVDLHSETTLRRLLSAVNTVRLIDAAMPIQTFAAFLVISIQEGQTINQVGDKIGLTQSSASRNVSALSDWDWRKKEGLKLVEYRQDPMNLSVKNIYLTGKGKQLMTHLVNAIQKGKEL